MIRYRLILVLYIYFLILELNEIKSVSAEALLIMKGRRQRARIEGPVLKGKC